MQPRWTIAALALLGVCAGGVAQQPAARSVNITSDSAAGWIPSVAQEADAMAAAMAFFKAQDEGRAPDAFDMMTPSNKAMQSLETFAASVTSFNAKSGAVIEHRALKVTWTKDGPNVPMPGAYAAIDFASRYAKIDRHCGYIVAYQPPAGGPFQIMRVESTMMPNESAASIERKSGPAEVERVWRQVSAACPGGTG